eukprot:354921-Chlamydomonas_euryale.AAC.21
MQQRAGRFPLTHGARDLHVKACKLNPPALCARAHKQAPTWQQPLDQTHNLHVVERAVMVGVHLIERLAHRLLVAAQHVAHTLQRLVCRQRLAGLGRVACGGGLETGRSTC